MSKLPKELEEKVRSIIRKAKQSTSLDEIEFYFNELKKIDLENRKNEIAKKVLEKYRK